MPDQPCALRALSSDDDQAVDELRCVALPCPCEIEELSDELRASVEARARYDGSARAREQMRGMIVASRR